MKTQIEFTRINNDTNGNPRYVCHFTDLLTDVDNAQIKEDYAASLAQNPFKETEFRYMEALNKARKIGGRKFHNKQYGGGIVFQSYDIERLESDILDLVNNGEVYPVMGDFNENGDTI